MLICFQINGPTCTYVYKLKFKIELNTDRIICYFFHTIYRKVVSSRPAWSTIQF
jgi:hypothetical protein